MVQAIAAAAHFESTMKQGNKDACCNAREANEREGHRSRCSPMPSYADHKIVSLYFEFFALLQDIFHIEAPDVLQTGIVTWTCQ